MNKVSIIVLLGLAAVVSASMETEINDLTLYQRQIPSHQPSRPESRIPIPKPQPITHRQTGVHHKVNQPPKITTHTTEALELFVKHVVSNNKNLTQVSNVLQLVRELLLVGSQCEQDLGGAFYVASVVAADAEAGFKDWQQDVIASVFAIIKESY